MAGHRSAGPPASGDEGTCAWPGCQRNVPADRLMDRGHWFALPKVLHDRIWAAYQPVQTWATCSPEYRKALYDVLAYARERQAETERKAEREARMQRCQGGLW